MLKYKTTDFWFIDLWLDTERQVQLPGDWGKEEKKPEVSVRDVGQPRTTAQLSGCYQQTLRTRSQFEVRADVGQWWVQFILIIVNSFISSLY